ncbi:MAG: AMP-binding protein [Stellaceae bacterium]
MRPVDTAATDRAWLFYTNGTTGRPKGAVLSHRNLLFMSHCYYADIDWLDERDTNLHAGPLSHGAGLYALPHLLRGGHQVAVAFRGRDDSRGAPGALAGLDVHGADHADPAGPCAGDRRCRSAQPADDLLWRRSDVCGRPRSRFAVFWTRLYHLYGRASHR